MTGREAHVRLMADLQGRPRKSWAQHALLACLERLALGGPTDGHLVKIHDGWALDEAEGICVIYSHAWNDTKVGVRVLRTSPADASPWLNSHGGADPDDPESFGMEVADYVIAEPLGSAWYTLVYDDRGVGWWGTPPLPLAAH